MRIGSNIRAIRKEKGLSQVETSKRAGIAVNSLRLYEADKRQPNVETLGKIANAFEVSMAHLLLGHDPKKREEKTDEQIVEEIEQELDDYIEKVNPKSVRLARFLANNSEFVSYLSKVGFEFHIDQDNILWAWYKKTYDYEISIEDLEFLESRTQSFIKGQIFKDEPDQK